MDTKTIVKFGIGAIVIGVLGYFFSVGVRAAKDPDAEPQKKDDKQDK